MKVSARVSSLERSNGGLRPFGRRGFPWGFACTDLAWARSCRIIFDTSWPFASVEVRKERGILRLRRGSAEY